MRPVLLEQKNHEWIAEGTKPCGASGTAVVPLEDSFVLMAMAAGLPEYLWPGTQHASTNAACGQRVR